MADLIDRQAVLDALEKDWNGMVVDVFDFIRNLPSVQPEPIMLRLDHELSKEECERLKKDCAEQPIILFPKESAQPGWIPVSERLPDNDDKVLCCTVTAKGMRNVIIGYYADRWCCGMNRICQYTHRNDYKNRCNDFFHKYIPFF